MRTTITLDDDTAALVREQMRRRGVGLKQVVNDALRDALGPSEPRPPFHTPTVEMGDPVVTLDGALAHEDDELIRKAALRK